MIEFDQYKKDLEGIRKSVVQSGEALHIDHMREQMDELGTPVSADDPATELVNAERKAKEQRER